MTDELFDNEKWEAENWTLAKAKQFAKKYNMQLGRCYVCKRPFIWQLGQYAQAPSTCGRSVCAETHYPSRKVVEA